MLDPSLFSVLLALAGPNPPAENVGQQFERWERRLRTRVTNLHVVPAAAQDIPACDVVLRFAIGQEGRPRDVAISKSSCSSFHDRTALGLVRSLGRIGPVPTMTGKDHRVVLKLTYGRQRDFDVDRRLDATLAAERETHSRRNLETVINFADRPDATALVAGR
ncbi:MAG: energy transducer TonB [Pseudomonadota bacterium]|nr:energy transducer TonB [Pseudomonadota bacterium]